MTKSKIYHLLSAVLLCTASLYITTVYAQSIDYIDAVFYLSKSKRPLKDEVTQTLEFDWEQKKAKYQADNEQKSPNPSICCPKLRLPFG